MTTRNHPLDLLRGAAVLMVVVAHCASMTTGVIPGLNAFAADYGQLGVQLFFIVSGYTMMLTFGDRLDLPAALSFYIRRAFRIVPLFWIAILFYLLMTKGRGFTDWAPDGIGTADVLLTFLFLHWSSVTAFNSIVPGGWSIGVEMQFYLLFPLLLYLFRQKNGPMVLYALIALVSIAGHFAEQYLVPQMAASLPKSQAHLAEGFFYCWLPRQSICFGFGILLYDCIERRSRPSLGALFLIGACLFSAWTSQVAILFAISLAMLARNLTAPAMGLVGRHSYAIYLVHFALLSAVAALFPLDLTVMFALVTGVSLALSYYVIEPLIERPFNRLGHVLASDVRRTKAVPTLA
jgi:exopolysaccharide production protein ExoZ